MTISVPPSRAAGSRPRRFSLPALAALVLAAYGVCAYAILPSIASAGLVGVVLWCMAPGLVLSGCLYRGQPGGWGAVFLAGPIWGYVLSSLAAVLLWVLGVRSMAALACAPLLAAAAVLPLARLRGALTPPRLDTRDLVAVLWLALVVPLVVGRPYARVGEVLPEGRAYRAYFTADFVWAMSVVGEIAKGDVPPRNPFLRGETLHYYWLGYLLPSIEHRATARSLAIEPVLLINALLIDLAFLTFLYWYARHFVRSPAASAVACAAAVLCTSFEGLERLIEFWRLGESFDQVRFLNIDAVTRWVYAGLPIDGLQRLLLYQPHHATALALGLSALLVLLQARDRARWTVNALAGGLLGACLLVSSFLAVMIAAVVATCQAIQLARPAQWTRMPGAALAGAAPIGLAVLVAGSLQYADRSASLVTVGKLNYVAAQAALFNIFLSFGPMLIGAAAGAWLAIRHRDGVFVATGAMIAVAFGFYFFVDVIDHQHVYVGWRAGHLLFIAFVPLVALAIQESWQAGRPRRAIAVAIGAVLALAAAPTTAIDLYNSQDLSNRGQAVGFRWTLVLTRDEIDALQVVKGFTAPDAIVQVEPYVRQPETWAYIPAFAERRMAAGLPISMIPFRRYQEASAEVQRLYRETDAARAYDLAVGLGIQYLLVGPPERSAYPDLERLLEGRPQGFQRFFRNQTVSVYRIVPRPRS